MSSAKITLAILEAVKRSPVEFITRFLKNPDGTAAQPHPGQIELLMALVNGVTDLVAACGRQWGKSVVLAWYICWFLIRYKNRQVYIIAPTLDQARIIFNEVSRHFRAYPLNMLLSKKITDFPFPSIQLINGSACHARGGNSPQYIRGKPAHLVIEDEAAFIKEGVHPNVIEPMLTVTGKMDGSAILRISTPFGQGDFFDGAEAARKDQSGRSRFFHFSSLDNPHADKERLFRVRDRYGEDSLIWQTEYLANFAASDLAVFAWADIKAAYEGYPGINKENGSVLFPQKAQSGHRYTQGVDLANRRDYFVSAMLDASDPLYAYMVRMDRLQQKGYATYKSIVRANYNAYNSSPTMIDATSLGESVVEDLGDINPEGFIYTGTSKFDIVHNLVRMFNERRIGIPFLRDIVDELRYFEYEMTPAGKLKMEARQGHDDIVMALALAASLASRPLYTGFFKGVDLDELGRPRQKKLPRDYTPNDDE